MVGYLFALIPPASLRWIFENIEQATGLWNRMPARSQNLASRCSTRGTLSLKIVAPPLLG